MQELEKILEEIDGKIEELRENLSLEDVDICYGLNQAKDIICKHMNDGWIPVERELPKDGKYILLSFSNFSLPMVGRYDRDKEGGGAFYLGDCDEQDTCIANDLYVNAWQPLPDPYRPERREENEHKAEKETIQKTVWT